ncbi:Cupredoxin [Podospora didyma]|uniref:Cupredoxin n=1 Tax=Podospora didyma TaxID=330526 RepID=A0AAE0NRU4_9PEZI|nr:Cupredoxin [Podospora didyma]
MVKVNVISLLGLGSLRCVAGSAINTLGMLEAPTLPKFLTNNPLPDGKPWGKLTSPVGSAPTTGVTRRYDFMFSRGVSSPDGFQKDSLLINGQSPGPLIHANWGDWIEITVHNNITNPDEGTALHWHGFLQHNTPWSDGVPSVSQCPIAPGSSYTYRIRAERPGTTWYHAHYSAQYAGGLYGPLVVYGPSHVDYDVDLGPIFVSDYFHREYFHIVADVVGTNATRWGQPSDNTMINARANFNCSLVTDGTPCHNNAGLSKFRFRKGKTYRLRLINSSAGGLVYFSIDNHTLQVVSADFVPIKPYNATYVTLNIGNRADVLVTAAGDKDAAFYMRATQPNYFPCARANQPNGTAIILYDSAAENSIPAENPHPIPVDTTCSNDPLNLTIPYYPEPLNRQPSVTRQIVATLLVNATGNQVYEMDNSSFHANYNNPLLPQANRGNLTFERQSNVYNFGSNQTVRIVFYNNNQAPHPMHLHGYDMTIVSLGPGQWDGTTVFRPDNPMRRDVQMLSPFSHLVVQFEANNPGVWAFHCHIAWHLSMGFYINVLVRPDEVRRMQIPSATKRGCDAWSKYTKDHTVQQIDDGA